MSMISHQVHVGTIALVALALSSAQLQFVSGATIKNVMAPRQSGPALNFKGNTAWPYGLCEVSGEIDGLGIWF